MQVSFIGTAIIDFDSQSVTTMILVQSLLGANPVMKSTDNSLQMRSGIERGLNNACFCSRQIFDLPQVLQLHTIYEHLESYLTMYIHVQATLVYFHDLDVHLMVNHELTGSIAFKVV